MSGNLLSPSAWRAADYLLVIAVIGIVAFPFAARYAASSLMLDVPLTRTLGASALVMASSLLRPIEPLDGGYVSKSRTGFLVNMALLALGIMLIVGVL